MNVADYLGRAYASPPCWSLVADVYRAELGQAVEMYSTVSESVRDIARALRLVLHKGDHGFSQIDAPVDMAVVLMGKTARTGFHHCGVYYQGKVLHALDSGALYQDMASLRDGYELMEFWAK